MDKEHQPPTQYMLHRGFRGMSSASLAGKVLTGG